MYEVDCRRLVEENEKLKNRIEELESIICSNGHSYRTIKSESYEDDWDDEKPVMVVKEKKRCKYCHKIIETTETFETPERY